MDAISSKKQEQIKQASLNLIISEVVVLFLQSRIPKVAKKDIQSVREIILNG